jgi:hypothetical protein
MSLPIEHSTVPSGAVSGSSLVTAPVGGRFVLLDPVRDSNFLNKPTTDALGNTIPDMGLGVVDNGLFVYTSQALNGVPRPYPVKFFWIGSPAGTNDANDNFSLFMADVDESAFFPGAPAAAWLQNPRLVLSTLQAGNDIINWFDANYPYTTTPASGGVGQETPAGQSNTTYGTLSTGGSVGNVSSMASLAAGSSIDGQFWPVYDYVDNSILLYFSIKTPNPNTKAIYCYKATNTEIPTPLTTSQFQGGVYLTQFGSAGANTLSSHRFSIISPDPLVTTARVAGKQSAVFFYGYAADDASTPDHTRDLQAGVLSDIHTAPLNWQGNLTLSALSFGGGVDVSGQYNPDKLGSIFVVPQGNTTSACYACLYNATTDRDIRAGSNAVVINAMQIRIAYFHPATNVVAFGSDPISFASGVGTIGHCRPQFTTYPDGIPKLIYNDFAFDQSLKTVMEYIDPQVLRPENHKKIYITEDSFSINFFFSTFGRKKLFARFYFGAFNSSYNPPTNNPQNDPQYAPVFQIAEYDGSYDHSTGAYNLDANDVGTLVLGTQEPTTSLGGTHPFTSISLKQVEFSAEDLPAYVGILMKAQNTNQIGPYGVIVLE